MIARLKRIGWIGAAFFALKGVAWLVVLGVTWTLANCVGE